jgi:ribose transport system permease protein
MAITDLKTTKIFGYIESIFRRGGQLISVFGALALLIIISAAISPNFITGYNITIISRDLGFVGIVAIAQGLLLLMGDIDISIGAVAGIAAVATAKLMIDYTVSPIVSVVIGLFLGAGCGLLNGFLITTFLLNPLVLTIGTQTVYTGLNLFISKGKTITGIPGYFTNLGSGTLFKIPIPFIIMLVMFLIALFITRKTVLGRKMYAVGNSMETALMVGIKTRNVRMIVYSIAGSFAAAAGILMSFRMMAAQTMIGATWLLPSIAAPVIGGIALTGGSGSIAGALLGAAIMGVIGNIVILGGVNVYLQQAVNGAVVIFAIILDSLFRRSRYISV